MVKERMCFESVHAVMCLLKNKTDQNHKNGDQLRRDNRRCTVDRLQLNLGDDILAIDLSVTNLILVQHAKQILTHREFAGIIFNGGVFLGYRRSPLEKDLAAEPR